MPPEVTVVAVGGGTKPVGVDAPLVHRDEL